MRVWLREMTRRFSFNNYAAGHSASYGTNSSLRDTSSPGQLSAEWSARVGALDVTQFVSFGVDDQFFTTTVTVRNTLSTTLYQVQYMRDINPNYWIQVRYCTSAWLCCLRVG
jgi:hypothetical protein